MRIAVLNLKGGTGKTTSAVFLATGLSRQGRTLLVDADPQGSALDWSEAAGQMPFPTIGLPVRDLHRRIDEVAKGYAHVVIDTPPGEGDRPIARSAAMAVDLVVVPLSPWLIEATRIRPTLELLADIEAQHQVAVRVLLNRVRHGTKSAEAARAVLGAEFGLPVMEACVPLREAYGNSFGLVLTHLADYEAVTTELIAWRAAA
ncbi:ParA family protein [Candidatus Nephthysia bennettiae]|uniref:ParA family protein n=1 Tax=Candidatus Nephthysia bennettiae TaxID=3127016 RepID=A0A934KDH7_9BACT|nr:ParA family protein [Candidatus Dormibacteraeota bacterium]MBJ7611931.1 ParA family protein [Candidatus Dormibacteraeota bacterium]